MKLFWILVIIFVFGIIVIVNKLCLESTYLKIINNSLKIGINQEMLDSLQNIFDSVLRIPLRYDVTGGSTIICQIHNILNESTIDNVEANLKDYINSQLEEEAK